MILNSGNAMKVKPFGIIEVQFICVFQHESGFSSPHINENDIQYNSITVFIISEAKNTAFFVKLFSIVREVKKIFIERMYK
jgi:hypothetical protein